MNFIEYLNEGKFVNIIFVEEGGYDEENEDGDGGMSWLDMYGIKISDLESNNLADINDGSDVEDVEMLLNLIDRKKIKTKKKTVKVYFDEDGEASTKSDVIFLRPEL